MEKLSKIISRWSRKFIKKKIRSIFFIFVLSFWTSETFAGPREGLGLFVDIGQLKAVNENTGKEYQKSKVFGGQIDYQFAFGESFSFSFFSSENTNEGYLPDNKEYEYYKAGIIGAELKLWLGSLYIGIHGGQYYLTWIESMSSYTGINWSGGTGYGLGLRSKSGWSIGLYIENSEKIDFKDFPDQRVVGNRIVIGYRWQ
tara:strand:+ start:493 stop:1092 length:600 start_codon:yes stop_codon:yes gene_type:complete